MHGSSVIKLSRLKEVIMPQLKLFRRVLPKYFLYIFFGVIYHLLLLVFVLWMVDRFVLLGGYVVSRSPAGHVISVQCGFYNGDRYVLEGPYVIFLEDGGQIEYTMKNDQRNGLSVKRAPNGEIVETMFFKDDQKVKDDTQKTPN